MLFSYLACFLPTRSYTRGRRPAILDPKRSLMIRWQADTVMHAFWLALRTKLCTRGEIVATQTSHDSPLDGAARSEVHPPKSKVDLRAASSQKLNSRRTVKIVHMRRAQHGRTRSPATRPTGAASRTASSAPRSKSFSRSGQGRGAVNRNRTDSGLKRSNIGSAPDRYYGSQGIGKAEHHRSSSEHRSSSKRGMRPSHGGSSIGGAGGSTAVERKHHRRNSDVGAESGDEGVSRADSDDEWSTSGFSSHRSADSLSVSDDYWIEEGQVYYDETDQDREH